jgi:hypothetical protein
VRGSFRIDTATLDKDVNRAFAHLKPDVATCSFQLTVSALVPIVPGSGTGAYAGISGSLHLRFVFAIVGPTYPSGKHEGA